MKKILLIDDSKPQLLSSKYALQRGGFQVETVSDPMIALDRIIEVEPDLIATDVNMPGKDGIAIVREVRQCSLCSHTPILVMSTDSQRSKLEEARLAGASGWLLKPVKQDDLLVAVKKLMAHGSKDAE